MNWRLGTMGFSYSDWAGVFYSPGTKPGDYLAEYAKYFDTVELDTTFHAAPPAERFQRWADVTPDHFKFAVKTPKTVTHEKPPHRAADEMRSFLDAARSLGKKLGVVLIQFSPTFEIDQLDALKRFLATLPDDVRYAVEFRNRTWGVQATLDLLRERRCCLVSAEYVDRPARIHVTTDFLYLRWVGEHQRFKVLNREQVDTTENLKWWQNQIATVADRVTTSWGFFNNDYSGYSVATCNRLKRMLDVPAQEPPAIAGGLFDQTT